MKFGNIAFSLDISKKWSSTWNEWPPPNISSISPQRSKFQTAVNRSRPRITPYFHYERWIKIWTSIEITLRRFNLIKISTFVLFQTSGSVWPIVCNSQVGIFLSNCWTSCIVNTFTGRDTSPSSTLSTLPTTYIIYHYKHE